MAVSVQQARSVLSDNDKYSDAELERLLQLINQFATLAYQRVESAYKLPHNGGK